MTGVERTATRVRGFTSTEMDFQLMRMLGAANAGGGTPGEIFAARGQIPEGDPYAWPAAFGEMADQLMAMARDCLGKNHRHRAAGHLLRASSYYRSAEYYSDPFGPQNPIYGQASRAAFLQAAPLLPHRIQAIDIPFEGHALPGYFMQPAGEANGRTLIIITGFDGTAEELYFQSAAAGLERGYTLVIAEGPGQVGCLRRHPDLTFRPDYEAPIRAMVDATLGLPGVDPARLALYGISFGGYFALRGASHDPRIRALVANSPITDLGAYMRGFTESADNNEHAGEDLPLSEVDEVPDEMLPRVDKLGFKSACRRFGVDSFFGWFAALEDYCVTNLPDIHCPVLALVGTGEGDQAMKQFEQCAQSVSGPVTRRVFTVNEGADMHCQLGNLPLSNAVIYDWLDDTL